MAKRTSKKRGRQAKRNDMREMMTMALLAGIAYGAQELLERHSRGQNGLPFFGDKLERLNKGE